MATWTDLKEVEKCRVACFEGNSRCKHREVGARRVWMKRDMKPWATRGVPGMGLSQWWGSYSVLSWIDRWDQPFRVSPSQVSQVESVSQRALDMTVAVRCLKHENCHFNPLNCVLSLRLTCAFIIVAESLFFHGNPFQGLLNTRTLNQVPPIDPGENRNLGPPGRRWRRQRARSTKPGSGPCCGFGGRSYVFIVYISTHCRVPGVLCTAYCLEA